MNKLTTINPINDQLWLTLVERFNGSVFHSPTWMRVLAETYGFDVCAQVLTDDSGQPVAGIPFVKILDIFGGRLVTMPFSDYCDPLVSTREHWAVLSQSLIDQQLPISIRPLHCQQPLDDEQFRLVKQAKWHRIDIAPDVDTIWKRNDESTYRAIRKAQRDGVTVEARHDKDAMRIFFEMHLGIRKYKYKMIAQPWPFFENIWTYWLDTRQGAILTAMYGGQAIAATLVLKWGDTLYYKFNASLRDQLAVRPNDLLVWELIQYAKKLGCSFLDFGLSDWDQDGLLRFKRKYATEEKTISFIRHTPPASTLSPNEGQLRGLMGQLTNLFTDENVGDAISEKAGNLLYRYFV